MQKRKMKFIVVLFALFTLFLAGCDQDTYEIIEEDKPDLIVSELTVTCWTPTSISYSYTIKNIGNAPAHLDGPTSADTDNVLVQAFLSADTIFNNSGDIAAGGTILGLPPLGDLNPGDTFSGSFSAGAAGATIDPTATPYLVLKVDWGEVVDEVDESNNTLATKLGEACLPDLIVTKLTVTSYTETTISYSYTIKNIGNAPAHLDGPTSADADNVLVQAFLSADTIFNNSGDIAAGGTILGLSPLGDLNPGDTFSGSFSAGATIDPTATPYLVLKVDWGEVVDETDENNNTLATPLVVLY